MMDGDTLRTVSVTAIVTGIIGVLIAWGAGAFQEKAGAIKDGEQALHDAHIRQIAKQVMVTDSGVTYASTLADINQHLANIDGRLDGINSQMNRLSNAVTALTSD